MNLAVRNLEHRGPRPETGAVRLALLQRAARWGCLWSLVRCPGWEKSGLPEGIDRDEGRYGFR